MIAWIAVGVIGYFGFVAFIARMASTKWHPDRGAGVGDRHD